MTEYSIAFLRVRGAKVSSALTQERLEVALWQNACLNFCTPYPQEGRVFTLIKNQKIQTLLQVGSGGRSMGEKFSNQRSVIR